MVQYYVNMLIPRAGIGALAGYFRLRRGIPVADLGAAQPVDRPVLGGHRQPGARVWWHTGPRPLLERRHQGVLGQLLGHA